LDDLPAAAPTGLATGRVETNYARAGDSYVAYQVLGSGRPLVLVADWFGNLDAVWEWPPYAHALRRLAAFSQLILFDKRGVGLSDPMPTLAVPGLDEWMEDVNCVMDAVGVSSAALMGVGAGGPLCLSVAAAHPGRVDRLVLVNSYARLLRADDYAPGYPEHLRDRILAMAYTEETPARILRGADDDDFVRWWKRYQRQSVSPGTAAAMRSMMFDVDVRSVLASVRAPTLILHRADDQWIRIDHGRYLAEHIDDSNFLELDGGEDLFFQGNVEQVLDTVGAFVTGSHTQPTADRVLATILFSDLVGSTDMVAHLGDQRWRVLLDDHDAIVARHIAQGNGRLVKTTGDGIVALFDGPGRAIRCAAAMRDELRSIGLRIRTGIHAGEIEVRSDDIGGIAVHIAARVMSAGAADEILVSRTVRDLVTGSGFALVSRGAHVLKGVPDDWDLYEVVS
jgi:class 3 adenylate cyclase/pimeloyl-ACP methyl ester carboxylesterase